MDVAVMDGDKNHHYRPNHSSRKTSKLFSFSCLRWSLILLNIFYIILGFILIGLAIASKTLAFFSEPHVLIGTAVSGAVLISIAILGLIGAIKHHQVILFFYMIILAISLLLMFSASVAALAVTPTLQEQFLIGTWNNLSNKDKTSIQDALNCCGFNSGAQNNSANNGDDVHPTCKTEALQASGGCCSKDYKSDFIGNDTDCIHCQPCYNSWKMAVARTVRLSGGFGLVFSFTQILGIVLTVRYRNEKDPSINPRAVL